MEGGGEENKMERVRKRESKRGKERASGAETCVVSSLEWEGTSLTLWTEWALWKELGLLKKLAAIKDGAWCSALGQNCLTVPEGRSLGVPYLGKHLPRLG